MSHRDTVAALIFLGSGFHFKAIEGAALDADPDLGQARTYLAIEAILVHAEETGRVAQTDKARGHRHTNFNNHRRPVRTVRFRSFRVELSREIDYLRLMQEKQFEFRGIFRADSNARRNTGSKLISWGFESQGLPRSLV
jgi:hypothetical protein